VNVQKQPQRTQSAETYVSALFTIAAVFFFLEV